MLRKILNVNFFSLGARLNGMVVGGNAFFGVSLCTHDPHLSFNQTIRTHILVLYNRIS